MICQFKCFQLKKSPTCAAENRLSASISDDTFATSWGEEKAEARRQVRPSRDMLTVNHQSGIPKTKIELNYFFFDKFGKINTVFWKNARFECNYSELKVIKENGLCSNYRSSDEAFDKKAKVVCKQNKSKTENFKVVYSTLRIVMRYFRKYTLVLQKWPATRCATKFKKMNINPQMVKTSSPFVFVLSMIGA